MFRIKKEHETKKAMDAEAWKACSSSPYIVMLWSRPNHVDYSFAWGKKNTNA